MPWEILGISIGKVNSTTNTDLNRTRDRFSSHARPKDKITETAVAARAVTRELMSIGTNCAAVSTAWICSGRMVARSTPVGSTTLTSRIAPSRYLRE